MGRVWDLIERHQAETPYGVSVRGIARAAGVSHTMLSKWTDIKRLPEPDHLRAVARQINVPYRVLLEAALMDAGYLLDERQEVGHGPAATTDAGVTPAARPRAVEAAPTKATAPTRTRQID